MLKQWWYRRKVVGAAKHLLKDVLRAMAKAGKKRAVPEEVLEKVAKAAEAVKEALGRQQLDHSEVERLSERLEVVSAQAGIRKPRPVVVEYVVSIAWAVGIALVIRTFLFEPFKIPTGSMIPSLLIDDYIFVTKSSYGFKLPFATNYLVRWGAPERGDVVVFPYPVKGTPDYNKDFIKRVVGLPGERLQMRNNILEIDGVQVEVEPIPGEVPCASAGEACPCVLQKEKLGKHEVITKHNVPSCNNNDKWRTESQGEFVVPEGHVFVMGDNRDNSSDGRFWGADGQHFYNAAGQLVYGDPEMKGRTVPIELLRGRAHVIWLASDFGRMFSMIP